MVTIQIAYRLLEQQCAGAELRERARELARLITMQDVCPSCWRLYSNGTRGQTQCAGADTCVLAEA